MIDLINNSNAPMTHDSILMNVLSFYGLFLICCGIFSVVFIGPKAKTALLSGGMSGCVSLGIAWLICIHTAWAPFAGILLSLLLFAVFSWRATKTLFKIFELLPSMHEDLKGKGIAFLIISLMAVVSITVSIIQIACL